MGLQLILVMETNRQCKSDWIYIKETIDHFYKYDTNQEDRSFFETVRAFCTKRGYHFVLFCQDIEQVYLGKSVENSKKCIESAAFKRKKLIIESDPAKLSSGNIRKNTSNIMQVLDQYLTRK